MNFAQMLGRGKRIPMSAQPSMTELFNGVAKKKQLETIMQIVPTGECMIWMTLDETDPMKALLSAALAIMVHRGTNTDADKGVSIRKVMGIIAPGCNNYWKVMGADGKHIADGYALTIDAAADAMREHLLPNL